MNPEKKNGVCPRCQKKTKFVSNVLKNENEKGKSSWFWEGTSVQNVIGSRSSRNLIINQQLDLRTQFICAVTTFKEGKMLYISACTPEKVVDPLRPNYGNFDRYLLAVEVTSHSLTVCPNVPLSLQNKRVEEGLMF